MGWENKIDCKDLSIKYKNPEKIEETKDDLRKIVKFKNKGYIVRYAYFSYQLHMNNFTTSDKEFMGIMEPIPIKLQGDFNSIKSSSTQNISDFWELGTADPGFILWCYYESIHDAIVNYMKKYFTASLAGVHILLQDILAKKLSVSKMSDYNDSEKFHEIFKLIFKGLETATNFAQLVSPKEQTTIVNMLVFHEFSDSIHNLRIASPSNESSLAPSPFEIPPEGKIPIEILQQLIPLNRVPLRAFLGGKKSNSNVGGNYKKNDNSINKQTAKTTPLMTNAFKQRIKA